MLFGLANHSGESLENKSAAIYFAQLPQIETLGWLGEANIKNLLKLQSELVKPWSVYVIVLCTWMFVNATSLI